MDARTGKLDSGFGDAGRVDLRAGMADGFPESQYGLTSPTALCGDVVVAGSLVSDGNPQVRAATCGASTHVLAGCCGDSIPYLTGDSSEGDQCSSVKAISSFAIPIRSRSAATLVGGLCRK